MSVMTLDRDKWKKFKTANNLSKSSVFKKADVGPLIEKFQKSVNECKKNPGEKSLLKCFGAADKLERAFQKFIKLKEAKQELQEDARKQLLKWEKELDSVVKGLAKLHKGSQKDLQQGDAKNMEDTFDRLGL